MLDDKVVVVAGPAREQAGGPQTGLEEWLGVLAQLWTAYDKPIDPERLEIYQNMLGKIPLGLLKKAVARAVSDHAYNSVPIVKEVWDALRKELGNPYDIDQAISEWEQSLWNRVAFQFKKTEQP